MKSSARPAALALALLWASVARGADPPFAVGTPFAGRALFGCSDVTLVEAQVGSDGVSTWSAKQGLGHVASNGDILLAGRTTVQGDVTAGPGRQATVAPESKVTGSTTPARDAVDCRPVDLAAFNPFLQANDDARIPKTAAGHDAVKDGALVLDGPDPLTLPPGTYVFSSIALSNRAHVILSGETHVFVTGDVSLTGNSHLNPAGGGFRLRLVAAGTHFRVDTLSTLGAFVYAPSAEAILAGGSHLAGSLFAGSILVRDASVGTRAVDDTPPLLDLSEPVTDAAVSLNAVHVRGTVRDPETVVTSVTVNGAAVPVAADGGFELSVDATATLEVRADAMNVMGLTSTVRRPLCSGAPAVAIASPANGSIVGARTGSVYGTCGSASTVTVNGKPATVSNGTFRADGVDFGPDGVATVTVIASNACARTAAVSAFIVDTTAPVLTIDSPAPGTVFGASPIAVSGTFVEANLDSITVNGVAAMISGSRFTAGAVPIPAGPSTLVALARDRAGRTGESGPVSVSLDVAAPTVRITSPASGFLTGGARVTVTGVAEVPNLAGVRVAGVPATLSGTAFTVANVPLAEGDNRLVAEAVDVASRTFLSAPIVVTLDTLPPTVTLDTAGLPALTGQTTLAVSGSVSDPHLAGVTVNGALAVVSGGRFAAAAVPLAEGDNVLTAHAIDSLGHAADSNTFTVNRDTQAPLVAITSPASNAQLVASSVTVTGTVSDAHLSGVTVNGVAAAVSGGGFTATLTLPEGDTTIVARGVDAVGNVGTSPGVAVTVDTLAPVVAIDPPADSVSGSPLVTVTGTILEPHLLSITVSGVPAFVTGGKWVATNVPLVEGSQEITAVAVDTFGHRATSAPVTFRLDSTPPTLTMDAPPADSAACRAPGGPVTVSGRVFSRVPKPVVTLAVQPAGGAAQNLTATLDAAGTRWSVPNVDLGASDGTATLTASTTDALGHDVRVLRSFRIKASSPSIALLLDGGPMPGAAAGAAAGAGETPVLFGRALVPRAAVTDGPASAPPVPVLTLDGAPWSGSPIGAEGTHLLVATATDCAGHAASAHALFTIDVTPPRLLTTAPADGAALGASVSTISGTSDPDLAFASVNGAPATVSGSAFSLSPFSSKEGTNALVIVLADRAGNRATFARSFNVKSLGPSVEILESGAPLGTGAVFFRAVTPVVRSNDATATVKATLNGATFTSGTPVSASGDYALSATATDSFGHTGSATASFRVDLTPGPALDITAPADRAVLPGPTVAVAGTASASVTSVTVNGRAATQTGTTWSLPDLVLPPDVPSEIVAIGADAAGRTASATRQVTVRASGPQITILDPADGSRTNRKKIDVAGAVLGGPSATANGTVTVAGATLALDALGTFRAKDVPLVSGANTITASATDSFGRTGTAAVTVTTDTTAPAIAIAADGQPLVDGASFARPFTLRVTVTDDSVPPPVPTIRLNGLDQGATAAVTDLPITKAGGYTLSVVARDAAGNESRADRSFVVASGGCAISALDPADGAIVAAPRITLKGRSGDAASVTVTSAGQTFAARLADGTFAAGDVPLPLVGDNTLTVACTDRAGTTSTVSLKITRLPDGAGPVVKITQPSSGAKQTAGSVAVSGTVSDAATAVTVNGVRASVSGGTFAVPPMPLAEGPNVLAARAVDAAGRAGEDRVVVFRDSTAPKILITSPPDGAHVGSPGSAAATVNVSGIVDLTAEPDLASVVVATAAGSITATVDGDTGAFYAGGVPLSTASPGFPQTVTATATDALGQSASASIKVVWDPSAPALVLAQPVDGTRFTETSPPSFAASGEAWAKDGAIVSINGGGLDGVTWDAPAADGRRHATFSAQVTVPAAEGPFGVLARVDEPSGAYANDKRVLFKDSTAPTVLDMQPADGAAQVDANEILLVLFSEPVKLSSLASSDGLTVTRLSTGDKIVGAFTIAGNAVAFTPGAAMARGESYRFRAGPGITDLAGHPLAAAKESRFTIATLGTSAPPTLDPLPPVVCATQLAVTGSAAPGSTVRVRDGNLSFTGGADATGRFTVTIPLSGNGWHVLHAAVVDRDGSAGPEVTALFRVDCSAPTAVGATFDRTTGRITVSFSEAMNPASLTVGGSGSAITVSKADDPTNAPQSATLSLSTDGATATLDVGNSPSAWWVNASVRLTVGAPAADAAGNVMAAPFTTVFFAGGGGDPSGGFLSGMALDDDSGRPLAGANAKLYTSDARLPGSVPLAQVTAPTASTVTDGRGRYSLTGDIAAGRYALVLSRTGYARALRRLALEPSVGAVPFGVRLTPLAPQAPALLVPASGGSFAGPAGSNASVDVSPNAVPSAASLGVILTPLSAQGLPEPLPLGFTALAAAELRLIPNGAGDDALPEGAGTPFTPGGVVLSLPLPAGINPADLYAARYDVVAGAWLALPLPVFVAGTTTVPDRARVALSGPGTVAIVAPDADPATRPPVLPVSLDAPLVGADPPSTSPTLTATIALDPAIVSPTGRATARVVAKSADGTTPWPSGLAVQAYLDEKLILAGGAGELYEAPFSADLVLYHSPPLSPADLGGTASGASGALTFRVSPSPRAAQVLLDTGFENVHVYPFTDQLERGQVLGPAGGSVSTSDGVELVVPESGLAQKTVVTARKLTATELAALPPVAGYTTVAAVRVSLSGATLARAATLRLTAPAGLPADAADDPRLVLATFVDQPDDGRGAFANAIARVTLLPAAGAVPAKLVAAPESSGSTLPFPGLLGEGLFVFLHASAPIGFATGRVTAPNGAGIAGSRVTAAGLGTANLSVPGGTYALPAPAGAATLTALHPVLPLSATGQVPALAKGQIATLDLVLTPVPPQIRSFQPANGAVDQPVGTTVALVFSAALDPTTITPATLTVSLADASGAPTGLLFSGSLVLSPDKTTVVFTPARPLPPGKRIAARFTGGVRDLQGTLYGGPLPVDWTFTTSTQFVTGGAIHPEKIRLLVPVNGVAQIIGADGTLPLVTGGTPPWSVWADVEGPVCPTRVTQPANGTGGFTLTAGCPPTNTVTFASKIWLHVIDPTGTEAATFQLGPFSTPDGKGFVATPGDDLVFTTAEGVEVTAPAAAFDAPTLVTVTKQPLDSLAVALNPGLEAAAVLKVDFEGTAKETLRLRIPVTTSSPVGGLAFAGSPIDLPWGRKLQVLEIGRLVDDGKGGKLISTLEADQPADPADASVSAASGQTRASRQSLALPKKLIRTIALEFTARATAMFILGASLELSAITGHVEPALVGSNFVVLYNALADAIVYRPLASSWNGRFILPSTGAAFTIVKRDIATGWIIGQHDYQAIPGETTAIIDVKEFDGPSFVAPELIDARPFGLSRFVATSVKDSEDCSSPRLEIEACSTKSATAKIRPTATPLAAESWVSLYNSTARTTLPQTRVDTAGTWGVPELELAAKDGDQLLVVVSPGDVSPEDVTSFGFDFSRQLVKAGDPNSLAVLYDCGPIATATCSGAPTVPIKVEQSGGGLTLEISLLAQLPAGHRFLLQLLGLKADSSVPVPYQGPADFFFATRKPAPGPIAGTNGNLPLGDAATARDMLKVGNLLLVASTSGRLVALDASSFLAKTPTAPYALLNGASGQIRALATDGHNRVFFNTLIGSSWAVKGVRLEDVREASAPCDQPPWAAGIPCFDAVEGGVKTAFAAGAFGSLSGSEFVSLVGSLPSGTPTGMDISVVDETTEPLELKDFYEANKTEGAPPFSALVPAADGSFTFPITLRSDVNPPPVRTAICDEPGQDRYQRITVDNLSTAQSWSFDVTTKAWPGFSPRGIAAQGIRARRGDQLRIRYNLRATAYLAIVGSGISVVDLNRFYGTTTPTGAGATQGNKSQCNRRLGKYEGEDIKFAACPAGSGVPNFEGISLTPAIAALGRTGIGSGKERGSVVPDVYTPLTHYGLIHSAVSTVAAALGDLGLQHVDDKCLLDAAAGMRSSLRDIAVAADVKWTTGLQLNTPTEVTGDLLFVSLGPGGVAIFDVSHRYPSLIGRFAVPRNYYVFHVQADARSGRLFTGGTDDHGKPVILVWDMRRAEGDPLSAPDPRLLATVAAAWDTNHIGIDESGTGLLYTWGNDGSAGQAVPVADPALVFVGRFRADATDVPKGTVAASAYHPADFLVPLGSPTRASADDETDNVNLDESRFTGAFKLRVALPGGLGEKLTVRVQSLRSIPDRHLLATDDLGALPAPRGGRGWPDPDAYLTLVRLGTGCPTGSTTPECLGGSGKFSTAFNLYESVETVLALSDPRARKAYTRQELSDDTGDEKTQCRRCDLPSFVDPKETNLKEVLVGGPYLRAYLAVDPNGDPSVQGATRSALAFFRDSYRAPAGAIKATAFADEVPSPVQVDGSEPPLGAAIWTAEAGASVSLSSGDAILHTTDHAVKGRSLGFTFDRTYRSGVLGYGPLGASGWTSSLFAHLRQVPLVGEGLAGNPSAELVEYHDGSGRVYRFYAIKDSACPASVSTTHESDPDASYCAPIGLYVRLLKLKNGQGFRLVDPNHNWLRFDLNGRLVEIGDRHRHYSAPGPLTTGSQFTLSYDGFGQLVAAEDELGRRYDFTYEDDPAAQNFGLLTEIEDFVGRTVTYEYDADRRLTSVVLPAVNNKDDYSSFSYDKPTVTYTYKDFGLQQTAPLHGEFGPLKLQSFRLPGGKAERVTFDHSQASGRVKSVAYPGSDAWSILFEPSADAAPVTQTKVLSPWGLTTTYTLEDGRTQKIEETVETLGDGDATPPVGALPGTKTNETSFTYETDGRPKTLTSPDGTKTTYSYKSSGDRLSLPNPETVLMVPAVAGTATYTSTLVGATYQTDNIVNGITDPLSRQINLAVPEANASKKTTFAAEGVESTSTFEARGRLKDWKGTPTGGRPEPTTTVEEFYPDAHNVPGDGFVKRVRSGSTTTDYVYDAAGNTTVTQLSNGPISTAGYDEWDRPISEIRNTSENTYGVVTQRAYDEAGHLLRERTLQDPLGWVETRYEYDDRERVTGVTRTHLANQDGTGFVVGKTVYAYDPSTGLLGSVSSPAGIVTGYRYDTAGRVRGETTGTSGERSKAYDPVGRLVYTTDGHEGIWRGRYDGWGRLYREELATGAVVDHEYDKAGGVVRTTTKIAGTVLAESKFHTTSFGQVDLVTESLAPPPSGSPTGTPPDARVVKRTFDNTGRLTDEGTGPSATDQRNDVHYDLDAANRVSSVTDAAGNAVVYRYGLGDDSPWPLSIERTENGPEGPLSLVSMLDHDSFGRVVKEIRSDGVRTDTKYDQVGNVVDVTSGAGTTVHYDYDGAGKLIKVTRPAGRGSTTYGYDLDGRVKLRRTTALGATWDTTYSYDGSGRLASIRRPDGTLEEFKDYYPDDTLKTYVSRQGIRVVNIYDAANRLLSRTPSGGPASVVLDGGDAYQYDGLSRLTKAQRPSNGAATVSKGPYDLGGRPSSETVGARGPVRWAYDTWDRPTGTGLPDGVGGDPATTVTSWQKRFDDLDRVVSVSPGVGSSLGTAWAWAGTGRVAGMVSNGPLHTASRFGYSTPSRLDTLALGSDPAAPPAGKLGTSWATLGYTYRPGDNAKTARLVSDQTSAKGGRSLFANQGWSWDLDGGLRLKRAVSGDGSAAPATPLESFDYGFGPGDELLSLTREKESEVVPLTPGVEGRVLARNGVPYGAPDAEGRRVSDDHYSYEWTWRGELNSVTVKDCWPIENGESQDPTCPTGFTRPVFGGHQVRYDYDALGRLLTRTHLGPVPDSGGPRGFIEMREYLWDGQSLLAEAAYAFDGAIRWRKSYVPGPGGLDDASQLRVEPYSLGGTPDTPRLFTYLRDELGTVLSLVEEKASADPRSPPSPVRYLYTPLGEAHAETGPELRRIVFDPTITSVAGTPQFVPVPGETAAGALKVSLTAALDPATLPTGIVIHRFESATGDWQDVLAGDFAEGLDPNDTTDLLVMRVAGWPKSERYRIRLTTGLKDVTKRPFVPPYGGTFFDVILDVPADGATTPAYDRTFPFVYDSVRASSETASGTFPGGQNCLFQGLWTDPVTGLSYARARWYSARDGVWISEDPLEDRDSPNLYGYVGLRPHENTDPFGLSWKTFGLGVAEGTANLALGLAQTGLRGMFPELNAIQTQFSVNFTRPDQPTLIASPRDLIEELKGATVLIPVGEMLGRFAGNAYLTARGWFDTSAPQDYLDELHADLGRDTPGVALTLAPLPKVLRGLRAESEVATSEVFRPRGVNLANPKTLTPRPVGVRFGPARGGGGNAAARAYARQITRDAEKAIYVNGTEFEGLENGVLLDAKRAGARGSWYDVSGLDKFTTNVKIPKILKQARGQLGAMRGTEFRGIRWVVADPVVAGQLRTLFVQRQIPIDVVHIPAR